jgi:antirestriction protein
MTISNHDDVIDSREIVERVAELEAEAETEEGSDDLDTIAERNAEHATLSALLSELRDAGDDSPEDGITLIRHSYFVEYAQELAEELGLLESESGTTNGWPFYCIDWEQAARELRMDYTPVEFDGVTYWVR